MSKVMRLLQVVAIGTMLWAAGTAWAGNMPTPQVSYEANSVMETSGMKMSGKLYAAPGMERREFVTGGQKSVIIVRHDKGVVWNLMPSERMYMENRLGEGGGAPNADFTVREKEAVGEEVINGLKTTKYKVIIDQNDSVFGGFMWVTADGITMKMDALAKDREGKTRIRQELTQVRIGKQNPSLFEIPAGYQKMGMGMPDMGALMGGMDDGEERPAGAEEEEGGGLGGLGDMMKGMKGLFGR